jgi:hypothetical protein
MVTVGINVLNYAPNWTQYKERPDFLFTGFEIVLCRKYKVSVALGITWRNRQLGIMSK